MRQYRWITVQDYLQPNVEFVLKLYPCGKADFFNTIESGMHVLFYNLTLFSIWDHFCRKIFLITDNNTQIISLVDIIDNNWVTKYSLQKIMEATLENDRFNQNEHEKRWRNHLRILENNFYPSVGTVFPLSNDFLALQGWNNSSFTYFK